MAEIIGFGHGRFERNIIIKTPSGVFMIIFLLINTDTAYGRTDQP